MAGGFSPVDDLQNATLDEYITNRVRDQFFNEMGLLGWMESRVGMDRVRGGDALAQIINTAENTQGGSYEGFDVFNVQPQETLNTAFWQFSRYQWPITAGAHEVLQNQGSPAAILDLWMEKADLALTSLRNRLNTDAFGDGTGNSNKNLEGIAISVDSTGTYGNINRATVTQWAAVENAIGGPLAINGANGMVETYNDCSLGSGDAASPDLIVTTQGHFEDYEDLLDGNIRYTSVATGDGSFGRLLFKGVPFMWDRAATTGLMYFLSSPTFMVVTHPERDYKTTEIQRAENGLGWTRWSRTSCCGCS